MTLETIVAFVAGVLDAITLARAGKPLDAANKAIDAGLALVPNEDAADFLTAAAVRRANIAGDAAEMIKFGSMPEL